MKINLITKFLSKGILVAFIAILFTIINCKRDTTSSPTVYSCIPEVNNWVIANFNTIQSFTREDFIKLDEAKQRAAYRSLTSESKLKIWRDKLSKEILSSNSEDERNHILSLLGMTDIKIYSDSTYRNNFVKNAQRWYDEAIQKFNWSKAKITLMVSSLYLSDESDNTEGFLKLKSQLEINPKPDCACHRDIFCATWFVCDHNANCNYKSSGCGWLWAEDCDGLCTWAK